MKGHLKAIGVNAGLFGIVHASVSKKFLKELDVNKDTLVTWEEFHAVAKNVLPAQLFDESGAVNMDLLEGMFAGTDQNTSGDLSREEMTVAALEAHRSAVILNPGSGVGRVSPWAIVADRTTFRSALSAKACS